MIMGIIMIMIMIMIMVMGMFNLNTLQIDADILSTIAKIDEFKGAWRALGTLAPELLPRACSDTRFFNNVTI